MTLWLSLNVVGFAAVMLFGWWGSSANAEAGHINGLYFIGGLMAWAGWVLIGSLAIMLMHFGVGYTDAH